MASAASVVTGAMKSLHSRLWKSPSPDVMAEPRSPYVETFDALRVYVERYDIDPNPVNYALLYRHFVRGEANLADNVTQLIETGYAPDLCDSCRQLPTPRRSN
jgi:hypothetical protein